MPVIANRIQVICVTLLSLFIVIVPCWGQQEFPYSLRELSMALGGTGRPDSTVQEEARLFLVRVTAPSYPMYSRSHSAIVDTCNPRMDDILLGMSHKEISRSDGIQSIGYDPANTASVSIVLQNKTGVYIEFEVALSVGFVAQSPSMTGLCPPNGIALPITFQCVAAVKRLPMAVIIQLVWDDAKGARGKNRKTLIRPITMDGLSLQITQEMLNSH